MSLCNKPNGNEPMAINLTALAGAGLGALQQSKQQKAAEGTKVYTKPKTLFGKLIGGVSGRTEAAKTSEEMKQNQPSEKVMNSMTQRTSTPVTGGFSFGGEAARKTYLPFVIVAGVVAIFYAMRRKKGTRRRY
jgi:hypothetical protein